MNSQFGWTVPELVSERRPKGKIQGGRNHARLVTHTRNVPSMGS